MPDHVNFFETVKESHIRLRGTVVLYDRDPYYVFAITNHRGDGVFRIYLSSIEWNGKGDAVPDFGHIPPDHVSLGDAIDKYMLANPERGILRKRMDSSFFNKFRPFPLGMCNFKGSAYYIERQPQRKTEQGLIRAALTENRVSLAPERGGPLQQAIYGAGGGGLQAVDMYTSAFAACIKGAHPSPQECIHQLRDPGITNDSAAFNRHFAFVRGPCDTMFIAYKTDVVGFLPEASLRTVNIGREFRHTKEVIEDLGIFHSINTPA